MPPASDNKKGKVRAEQEDDREGDSDGDDNAPETAPLLRPASSTTAGDARGAGKAPASRPASAILRHGRGLLSEDEGGSQRRRSTAFAGADSQGAANGDDTTDDEDDEDDDAKGAGLLGWRRRRSSSSSRRRRRRRPSWKGALCYVFLALLAVAFIAFAVIHLWIGRFVSEQMADNASRIRARAQDALLYRGPDSMKVLSMDSNTTTVQVQMRVGIDVRTVFGWNETHLSEVEADDGVSRKQQQRARLPLSRRLERKIIGWATRRIGVTAIDLPEPILVSPLSDKNRTVLQLALLHPVSLPLYFPKADRYNISDLSWLRNITLTVPLEVLDPELMADFVNRTMESNQARVHVRVQKAHVTLGREGDRSWLTRQVQRNGAQTIEGIELDQVVDVPEQPELPRDPQELVQLQTYALIPVPHNSTHGNHSHVSETLSVQATARVLNPGYKQLRRFGLDLDIPFSWPYKIFLPSVATKGSNSSDNDRILLARGVIKPFTIPSNETHFNVSIVGHVESTANDSTPLSHSLSHFVTRFLRGRANTVYVQFDPSSPYAREIPSFLIPLLRGKEVSNDVPGLPQEQRDLLKDLQMEHLKVHGAEGGQGGFECDGEMVGEIVLPPGLESLDHAINITSIWPDILLYDGLPPTGVDKVVPPSPLPPNAFARFRPRAWSPATTYVNERNATIMQATVTNVPLEILRPDVLRRWIAKLVFSGGAGVKTGVKGLTRARATVRAFGDVQLDKLPVWGTFYAQKPSVLQMMGLQDLLSLQEEEGA